MTIALGMPSVPPVHGWHCACVECLAHPRPLPPAVHTPLSLPFDGSTMPAVPDR